MRRNLCLSLFLLGLSSFLSTLSAEGVDTVVACPEIHIETEYLPNLNVARCGHTTILAGNEPLVVGGHTTGFVPTPTAEYYHDGQWHLLSTVYTHDEGFAIPMNNGKVLIAGGHEQPLGIGHTFSFELYDPQTHTFEGYGSLEKKRTWAECLEMDSGKVLISGNWYARDGIECYQGSRQCINVKDVSVARTLPYIFRTGRDDAIILGGVDEYGEPFDTIVIDRLKGDAFTLPFFEQWKPQCHLLKVEHRSADSFIGDEATGQYDYLMAVSDQQGQMAVARVHNGHFSILPTSCPIPTSSQFGTIEYFTTVIVDRQSRRGRVQQRLSKLKPGLKPEEVKTFGATSSDKAKLLSGKSVTFDRDVTYYYIHKATGKKMYFSQSITQKIYAEEFYEVAKLGTNQSTSAVMKATNDAAREFAKKMDQTVVEDVLRHAESYGKDLPKMLEKALQGQKLTDPIKVAEAVLYKGQERFYIAQKLMKAAEKAGDGKLDLQASAISELIEGCRQQVKVFGLLDARDIARLGTNGGSMISGTLRNGIAVLKKLAVDGTTDVKTAQSALGAIDLTFEEVTKEMYRTVLKIG